MFEYRFFCISDHGTFASIPATDKDAQSMPIPYNNAEFNPRSSAGTPTYIPRHPSHPGIQNLRPSTPPKPINRPTSLPPQSFETTSLNNSRPTPPSPPAVSLQSAKEADVPPPCLVPPYHPKNQVGTLSVSDNS